MTYLTQEILDNHISTTIDKINDDGVDCYRPINQETYGDDTGVDDPSLLIKMRQQFNVSKFTSPGESDSAYSGSPSPEVKPERKFVKKMGSTHYSLSEDYIPNQPCSSQYFISDQSAMCPDLMFSSSTHYLSSPPVNYLPPVWAQLHHMRHEIQKDSQYAAVTSGALPYNIRPQAMCYGTDYLSCADHPEPVLDTTESDDICDTPHNLKQATTWRLQCRECSRRFNSDLNLQNHMDAIHKGIRPFKCNLCDKTFAQRATLRTHLRTHTGEKPYKCNICERRFADLSTCKKHQRVHDGQKPYGCDICGKRFSQSGNMLRHKEGHERKQTRGVDFPN